jgi:hypothetical protein
METINTLQENFPDYSMNGGIELVNNDTLITLEYDTVIDYSISYGWCEIQVKFFRGCSDLLKLLSNNKDFKYHTVFIKYSYDCKSLSIEADMKFVAYTLYKDFISLQFEVKNVRTAER